MLEFQNICAFYGKQTVLKNISLTLPLGQITAIIGKNGCGKSTLVSCLNEQVTYTGQILLSGRSIKKMNLRKRAQKMAILPQVLCNLPITVEELVQMGRNPYVDLGRPLTPKDWMHIEHAISIMNITSLRYKKLKELSGGQRQKAYVAMILAQNTDILILDEPTTYMDMAYEAEFMRILIKLKNDYKKTILIIMHDLTSAVEISDNVAIMEQGTLLYTGTTSDCIQTGIIENVFQVHKYVIEENGRKRVLYHN